jgi:hypothetical protein
MWLNERREAGWRLADWRAYELAGAERDRRLGCGHQESPLWSRLKKQQTAQGEDWQSQILMSRDVFSKERFGNLGGEYITGVNAKPFSNWFEGRFGASVNRPAPTSPPPELIQFLCQTRAKKCLTERLIVYIIRASN